MDISKRLISLRQQCGYTQNGLAERAGVSQSHLRRVELGESDITVGLLQLLCDAMNISLKEFLDDAAEEDEFATAFSNLSPKQKKAAADISGESLSHYITKIFLCPSLPVSCFF